VTNYSNENFKTIRDHLINNYIEKSALDFLLCIIRNNHWKFLNKHISNSPDLGNLNLLRYLTYAKKRTFNKVFPIFRCALNNSKHGGN